ncbi:MAG TPA: hypothetical protein VMQ73_02640, partial [Methylomirabilota bacterium]|nr:hypothetical protein [Methylomirabilota bacterium]
MAVRAGILAFLALALTGPAAVAADMNAPLVLEATIPLKDVRGRIDHMAVDLVRRRLAVAELGNDTVDVIDLGTGRVVHRIADLKEPQGVAFAAAADVLVVANGDDGSVRFFGADDVTPVGRIDLGSDADNVRIDKNTGRVVVGYGAGGLAVIDPAARTKLADVPLPVHPEGFQLAPDGKRAYVNLPDAWQAAVV